MTTEFDIELKQRLDALREQNLLRELRCIDSPQAESIQNLREGASQGMPATENRTNIG